MKKNSKAIALASALLLLVTSLFTACSDGGDGGINPPISGPTPTPSPSPTPTPTPTPTGDEFSVSFSAEGTSTYVDGVYTIIAKSASEAGKEWQNQIFISNPNSKAGIAAGDKIHATITVKSDKAVSGFFFKDEFNSGSYSGLDNEASVTGLEAGVSKTIDLYGTVALDYAADKSRFIIDLRGNEADTKLELSDVKVEKMGSYDITHIEIQTTSTTISVDESLTLITVDQYGFAVEGVTYSITSSDPKSTISGNTLVAGNVAETVVVQAKLNDKEIIATKTITVTAKKDYGKYFTAENAKEHDEKTAKTAPGYMFLWSQNTLSNVTAAEKDYAFNRTSKSEWYGTQVFYAAEKGKYAVVFNVTSSVAGKITVNKAVYELEANTAKKVAFIKDLDGTDTLISLQLGVVGVGPIDEGTFKISEFSVTDASTVTVSSVQVIPAAISAVAGAKINLSATVNNEYAVSGATFAVTDGTGVTGSAIDGNVLTVGTGAGKVSVTATYGGVTSAPVEITVTAVPVDAYTIEFSATGNTYAYADGAYTLTINAATAASAEWANQIFIKNPNTKAGIAKGDYVRATVTAKADKAITKFFFKDQFNGGSYSGIDNSGKVEALEANVAKTFTIEGKVADDYDDTSSFVIDLRGNEAGTTLVLTDIKVEKTTEPTPQPSVVPTAAAGAITNTIKALYYSATDKTTVVTTDFGQNWWQFGGTTDYTISEGVVVKKLSFNAAGGSCGWLGESEVTDKTYLHAEVFCKSNFTIKPVDAGDGYLMPFTASEAGWHAVDIPVKPTSVDYAWNGGLKKIGFVSTTGEDLYVDNVYTYEKETPAAPVSYPYVVPSFTGKGDSSYQTIIKASDIPSDATKLTITIDSTKCSGSDDWWFGYGVSSWLGKVEWDAGINGYKAEITGDTLSAIKAGGLALVATSGLVCTSAITVSVAKDTPTPAGETLPFLPKGNNLAKIEGAGIWIYLDNTNLGITGANAAEIIAASTVSIKDHASGDAVTVSSWEFNDYADTATPKTVRLYVTMPDANHTTIDVTASLKIGTKTYSGTASFVNGVYQFDFTPTDITLSASAAEVKPSETVTFTVKGSPYDIDITDKCTFSIAEGDKTGSSISGKTLTAGATNGTVTVKAKLGNLEKTIDVKISSSALPTILPTSKIEGAGVQILISKEVVATTPAKEDITVSGKLETTEKDYQSYVSDNLTLNVVETNDQGTQSRIYFTQPAGFPDGKAITETFVIKWGKVTVNAVFEGNALKTSSVEIAQ